MGFGRWIWLVVAAALAAAVFLLVRETDPPADGGGFEDVSLEPPVAPAPEVPPPDDPVPTPPTEVVVETVPPTPSEPGETSPPPPLLPTRRELVPPTPGVVEENVGEAWADLEQLQRQLRASRSINEVLIGSLDVVGSYHQGQGWSAGDAERAKYRKAAEKAFLKALVLTKVHRSTDRNVRDIVNIKAAQVLGKTGNAKLSKDLVKAIEKHLLKAKHTVPVSVYEAAFEALARLGEQDAFEWMVHEFVHTKSSPPKYVDQLVAAHKALVRFEDVVGLLRHKVVKDMVRAYAGTESSALAGDEGAKRFWDRIRVGVLRALQHHAGKPTDDRGEALATMAEFTEWFRAHKDPRRDPWVD